MRHVYRSALVAFALSAFAIPAFAQTSNNNGPVVRPWQSIHPGLGRSITNPAPKPPPGLSRVRPVPEPSQWALMATGVGLVAWIVRRRSKRNKD